MHYAHIGSISHGTCGNDDLLATFASELDALLAKQPRGFKRKAIRAHIREAERLVARDATHTEHANHVLEELFEDLEQFAPPYCYFGATEGDGSDFGFWLSPEWEREAMESGTPIRKREPDAGYHGDWFHVNDHGNVTLYCRNARGHDTVIWSIV